MNWSGIQVGDRVGEVDKGVVTTAHIMRWSAAVENFHRIHYDQQFAREHDKLPDVLVNGSWKQHVLVQLAKDALGIDGWLWKIKFRYKKMDVANDAIRGAATVVAKQEVAGFGFVTLRVVLTDQNDAVSTTGFAIGVLPLPGGAPVPYPFVPKPAYDAVTMPADE
jgi:acyl dehydratase